MIRKPGFTRCLFGVFGGTPFSLDALFHGKSENKMDGRTPSMYVCMYTHIGIYIYIYVRTYMYIYIYR